MNTPLHDAASDAASRAGGGSSSTPENDSPALHGIEDTPAPAGFPTSVPGSPASASTPPPLNEGAKVKMGLYVMSTDELIPYIQNHIEMMTDNPNFPAPQPPSADFQTRFSRYQDAVAMVLSAETALRAAIALREQERGDIVGAMNVRAAYVQQASNGNRRVITSSGLGVKNAPTYVTSLAAPTNLRVELNGEAGMMKIRWDSVPNGKTYLLQYRRHGTPDVWETLESTTKTSVTKTLEVGVTYVFRVAANGTPGMSNWSAEVIRGAA